MSQNIVTARARHIDYGINKALFVGQYRCRTLNLAAPMPNFIIVTFEDGEKEVYFGWDYDFSPNNLVMASSNIRIIEYFDRLFDKMFASGADIKQDLRNNTHQ